MSRKKFSHNTLFDWFAPLYDLGIWLLASFVGGEEKLRGAVVDEVTSDGRGRSGLKGLKTLELFAGTATLSLEALKRGANPVALDLSLGMLRVARDKAQAVSAEAGSDKGGGVSLIQADAAELPFDGGSFDRVFVSLGLHEAAIETVRKSIREAYRVLGEGGRFTVFDFYRAGGAAGAIQKVFFIFFEGETAREFVKADIERLLAEAGFRNFRRKFLFGGAFQLLTVEKK